MYKPRLVPRRNKEERIPGAADKHTRFSVSLKLNHVVFTFFSTKIIEMVVMLLLFNKFF